MLKLWHCTGKRVTQEVEKEFSGSATKLWSASFGQVDAILSSLHDVESSKRTAFQARLKHFLKLGALENVKQGRGKAARYSAGDLIVLATLCDITKMGISPENCIALIGDTNEVIAQAAEASLKILSEDEDVSLKYHIDQQVVMFFAPNYLSGMSRNSGVGTNMLGFGSYKDFVDFILVRSSKRDWRNIGFINFTGLLRELMSEIQSRNDFVIGLRAWAADKLLHTSFRF